MITLSLTKEEARVLSNAYALYAAVGLRAPKEIGVFALQRVHNDFEDTGATHDAIESLADKMSEILFTLNLNVKEVE